MAKASNQNENVEDRMVEFDFLNTIQHGSNDICHTTTQKPKKTFKR